jgi:hypothetical protein
MHTSISDFLASLKPWIDSLTSTAPSVRCSSFSLSTRLSVLSSEAFSASSLRRLGHPQSKVSEAVPSVPVMVGSRRDAPHQTEHPAHPSDREDLVLDLLSPCSCFLLWRTYQFDNVLVASFSSRCGGACLDTWSGDESFLFGREQGVFGLVELVEFLGRDAVKDRDEHVRDCCAVGGKERNKDRGIGVDSASLSRRRSKDKRDLSEERTLFPDKRQRPGEDVHKVWEPVRMRTGVELADVEDVLLVLEDGGFVPVDVDWANKQNEGKGVSSWVRRGKKRSSEEERRTLLETKI